MNKALPLAVFDWNGTLLDDVNAWVEGCNSALSVFNHPARDVAAWRELYTCPIIHSYEKAGVSIDEYLEKSDEANTAFYDAYVAAMRSGYKLRQGAEALLDNLKKAGYHITILSNHHHDLLGCEIVSAGIVEYFDHICGNLSGDDITHKLTKQERLARHMSTFEVDLSRSFIIGDSHEEPYVARALGLRSVAINGGYVSSKRLAAARPDVHIDALSGLLSGLEAFPTG
jgi:phosphoglycolate phosphatase-like HAD superfamily hydrolase